MSTARTLDRAASALRRAVCRPRRAAEMSRWLDEQNAGTASVDEAPVPNAADHVTRGVPFSDVAHKWAVLRATGGD